MLQRYMKLPCNLVLYCKTSRRAHDCKVVDSFEILPVFGSLKRVARRKLFILRTYHSYARSMGFIFVEALSAD